MSKQKYIQKEKSTVSSTSPKSSSMGREHYSQAKANAKKNKRRDEAEDRNAKYKAFTIKEKLNTCIPGGSKKQRAKLEAVLNNLEQTGKFFSPSNETVKKFRTPKSQIIFKDAKANAKANAARG